MDSGTILMIVVIVLALVGGTIFTLWWWKQADKWADAEHKRFTVKVDTRPKIVVRGEAGEEHAESGAVKGNEG